ncbi:MAG: hypothetical protein Q4B81_04195 [Moraxella sp.]|nr:hypothetical protein [Moraxella sp.]
MTVKQQKTLYLVLTAIGLLMAFVTIAYCTILILDLDYWDNIPQHYILPLAVISLPLAKYGLIKYERLNEDSQND